jgi:hypothetical protein
LADPKLKLDPISRWANRTVLEQRGILPRQVSDEMDRIRPGLASEAVVSNCTTTALSRRAMVTEAELDTFDAAVTRISDARGGVFGAAGATTAGIAEMTRQLEVSRIA